jgi:hypothetical protein
VVEAITESRPFRAASVADITKVQLSPAPTQPNPYFVVSMGARPDLIRHVEVRESKAGRGGVVLLGIDPSAAIHPTDLRPGWAVAPTPSPPDPAHGDATQWATVSKSWGQIRFGYRSGDDVLVSVVLDGAK